MEVKEVSKEFFGEILIAPVGILLLFFLIYILPVIVLAKLLDAPIPTKETKEGEALDFKTSFLMATAFWFLLYATLTARSY